MNRTPNTPANGGQILTPARISELWSNSWNTAITEAGVGFGNADVAHMKQPIHFARAIEADLRASLAATATQLLASIRDAISTDRCDGSSSYAHGVNAAVARHTEMIDSICAEMGVAPASTPQPAVPQGWKLVPLKLTPKMADVLEFGRKQPSHNTYLNLLAAAPADQSAAKEVEADHETK